MIEFEWQPWFAMLTVAAVFLGLQLRRGAAADVLFLSGLLAVTAAGVVSVPEALAGFSNPAVLAIAGLLAVSAGLRSTGVLDWIGRMLLGSSKTEGSALRRLAVSLIVSSAFVLNTVLVAMMMPVVIDWCRRRHISPSRLLLPVSYLAILGGVCTLIGTSTTLVVNGLLESEHLARSREVATLAAERPQQPAAAAAWEEEHQLARKQAFLSHITPMRLFDISAVGIPCALAGAVALILLGARFLPNRDDLVEQFDEHRREYLVEMRVMPECRLIGQTVEQAGLRHLPGLYLIEIDRDGDIITPVSPTDVMQTNDRLIFTGVVSTIVDLEKIPGLAPAADSSFTKQIQASDSSVTLTEVVLSRTSPLIGRTVKEANFRQLYGAAVVAVHRNGVRLTNKIGNIHLEPGDTLLLQTRTEFVPRYRNSRDFYLVSSVEAPNRDGMIAPLAGLLMLGLIVWLSATSLFELPLLPALASPPIAAFIVVMIMIATRCLPTSEARSAIELPVLLTVIGALGLGRALTESGAAQGIAERLVWAAQGNPYFLLIVVYLVAALFTELITNVAVATMLFPIAVAVAWEGGYNPRPFIMAIAIASSLTFLTPVGYQSNLMVMGPGGYRPIDYLRCGLPVSIAVAATALVLLPRVWPF